MWMNIILLISLVIVICWKETRRSRFYPPGPNWLPFIGNILIIRKLLKARKYYHLLWQGLADKYGSLVGLKLGSQKLVIVSGKDMIREFYAKEEFDGRPDGFFFRVRSFDKRLGIVFVDGHFWEVQRRFSMRTLKQLGLGRQNMFDNVEREAREMIELFKRKSSDGSLIEMNNAFDIPVLNLIWTLIAGTRFDLEDERLKQLTKLIHDSFRIIDMSGGILNIFPAIRFIMPERCGYKPLVRTLSPLWTFLTQAIDQIKANPSSGEFKSLIEAFLIEMEAKNHDSSFTEQQLLALCLDIFQAGSETTSNTLGFGMIYMLHFPNVLAKVQQELDTVVGRHRLPNFADRPQLRYTEAVICEIMRLSTVAPLGIVHRCLSPTRLGKYIIPKDALAIVSLYSMHMDYDYWGDPTEFRPERFLDIDGNLVQHEYFLPFGAGKRRCMGENLAKSNLFLFFASFIHSFEMLLPVKNNLPDSKPIDGITLSPKSFKVFLKQRL